LKRRLELLYEGKFVFTSNKLNDCYETNLTIELHETEMYYNR
jgi:hypothetical protein